MSEREGERGGRGEVLKEGKETEAGRDKEERKEKQSKNEVGEKVDKENETSRESRERKGNEAVCGGGRNRKYCVLRKGKKKKNGYDEKKTNNEQGM